MQADQDDSRVCATLSLPDSPVSHSKWLEKRERNGEGSLREVMRIKTRTLLDWQISQDLGNTVKEGSNDDEQSTDETTGKNWQDGCGYEMEKVDNRNSWKNGDQMRS
jgi:hypothetical protein